MAPKFINKLNHEIGGLNFFLRNLRASYQIQPISKHPHKHFIICGLPKNFVDDLDHLHQLLRDGRKINYWRRSILLIKGKSVCCIAKDETDKLIGFDYFYFRENEVNRGIIHEAYIGVAPEYRGQGIGTALRMISAKNFAISGLSAISSQIEEDNLPSLNSALHAGFHVINNCKKDKIIHLIFDLSKLKNSADLILNSDEII